MTNATHFIEVSNWYGKTVQSSIPIVIGQFEKVLYATRCISATTVAIFYIKQKPDNREMPCMCCDTGEYLQDGYSNPNGTTYYECNQCNHRVSFP